MTTIENRKFPRFRVDPEWELEAFIEGVDGVVMLHEVGAGGCGLFTDSEKLRRGQSYILNLKWPANEIDSIKLSAELVYRVKSPQHINSNLYFCGFQVSDKDRLELQKIVALLHDLIETQAN